MWQVVNSKTGEVICTVLSEVEAVNECRALNVKYGIGIFVVRKMER